MTDFSDFRQNPFDSTFSDRVMDPEIHTVAEFNFLPGIYGIALQDRPVATTVTIVTNNTAATPYTEVTTNPLSGQFRVDYVRGLIQFNSADNGDSVEVNYSGRGSNVNISLIQALIGTIVSTFTTITAALAAGLNFVSENSTAVARFGAGNTSLAEFFGSVNITTDANITGKSKVGDGTVSAPGQSFLSEAGSGLWRIGAGIIGWAILGVEKLRVTATQITSTVPIYAPGAVVQVVSTTKTDTFSYSASAGVFGDVTGLSVSITPKSTSSKILVTASVSRGVSGDSKTYFRLVRDSTAILIGDSASSRVRATSSVYMGSPNPAVHEISVPMQGEDTPATTSVVTYKIQIATDGTNTHYVNRSGTDTDSTTYSRTVSTITVMEIGA